MANHMESIPLRVLTYFEDEEWVSHILEMDLVGVGSTPEESERQLQAALDAQFSFCMQNHLNPFRPAPRKYFDAWNKAQKLHMERTAKNEPLKVASTNRIASALTYTAKRKRSSSSLYELAE